MANKPPANPKPFGGQNVHRRKLKTAEQLALKYGVSERTIRRNAKFAEAVDALTPELRNAVLSGRMKLKEAKARMAAG
jgi:hypothetical protein